MTKTNQHLKIDLGGVLASTSNSLHLTANT